MDERNGSEVDLLMMTCRRLIAWTLVWGSAWIGERTSPAAEPKSNAESVLTRCARATVVLRKGTTQGSGTIIASTPGETIILTAAHTVANKHSDDLKVELHRYNLGLEDRSRGKGGTPGWPRVLPAEIIAFDDDTDVAFVKLRGLVALPHVARVALDLPAVPRGEVVTSLGIDHNAHLLRWEAKVVGLSQVDAGQGPDGSRSFLVTDQAPELGRSGGGLFRADGTLVGICVGRVDYEDHRPPHGLFAPGSSIRSLAREAGLTNRLRPVSVATPTSASGQPRGYNGQRSTRGGVRVPSETRPAGPPASVPPRPGTGFGSGGFGS